MEAFNKIKVYVRLNSNLNAFDFISPVIFVLMLQLFKSYQNKEFKLCLCCTQLSNLKINTISSNTEIISCLYLKWVYTLLRH